MRYLCHKVKKQLQYELRYFATSDECLRQGNFIQTAHYYLSRSKSASGAHQEPKFSKQQEVELLISLIEEKDWWYDSIDENNYISEGAEQKVYLSATEKCVIKTNTTIFYAFWSDYLDNLLLHNLFFPTTQYELLGFTMQEGTLCAVVKQPFVPSNEDTDIAHVKRLLASNGFVNNKNND